MARLTLSPTRMASGGAEVSPTAANADGYALPNDGSVFLFVRNTNGASAGATVTLRAEETLDGLVLPDKDVSVDADEEFLVGPFSPGVYNRSSSQTDAGTVHVDFSGAVADLEIQAFRFVR